jgi:hypothetical protein
MNAQPALPYASVTLPATATPPQRLLSPCDIYDKTGQVLLLRQGQQVDAGTLAKLTKFGVSQQAQEALSQQPTLAPPTSPKQHVQLPQTFGVPSVQQPALQAPPPPKLLLCEADRRSCQRLTTAIRQLEGIPLNNLYTVPAKTYLKAAITTYQPTHLLVGLPHDDSPTELETTLAFINTLLNSLGKHAPANVVLLVSVSQHAQVQTLLAQTKASFLMPQQRKPLWHSLNQAKLLLKPITLGRLSATLGLEAPLGLG